MATRRSQASEIESPAPEARAVEMSHHRIRSRGESATRSCRAERLEILALERQRARPPHRAIAETPNVPPPPPTPPCRGAGEQDGAATHGPQRATRRLDSTRVNRMRALDDGTVMVIREQACRVVSGGQAGHEVCLWCSLLSVPISSVIASELEASILSCGGDASIEPGISRIRVVLGPARNDVPKHRPLSRP